MFLSLKRSAILALAMAFCLYSPLTNLRTSLVGQEIANGAIAATVNEHRIAVATVQKFLTTKFGQKSFTAQAKKTLEIEALEHLIRRAIVQDYLKTKGRWAGDNEIKLEIERFESQLSRADISLESHLKQNGSTREQLAYETGWRISWARYLNRTLTDANLEKYFQSKRKQFDGTQLKTAHLLIKNNDSKTQELLKSIREELATKPFDWSKKVAQHSDAASKNDGGEVGWIGFSGPMPATFTEAAFALEIGEVSPPTQTKFGTHLIKCIDIKPGKKGFKDAREAVTESAKKFLFFKLAADHRPNVKIKYSEDWPHAASEHSPSHPSSQAPEKTEADQNNTP